MADSSDEELNSDDEVLDIGELCDNSATFNIKRTKKETNLESSNDASSSSSTRLNTAFITPETPEIGQNLYRPPHLRGVARPILGRNRETERMPQLDSVTEENDTAPTSTGTFVLPQALREIEQSYWPAVDDTTRALRAEFVMTLLMGTLTQRREPNLALKKDNDTRKCPTCGAVIKLYKAVNPDDYFKKHCERHTKRS